MRRDRSAGASSAVLILTLILAAAAPLAAQDLETAQNLFADGELEGAKRMAAELLAGGLSGEEGIEALDILASVAIAEGDYETAVLRLRAILAAEPGATAARDAQGKLTLIGRLVGEPAAAPAAAEMPGSAAPAPDSDAAAATAPAAEPAAEEAPAEIPDAGRTDAEMLAAAGGADAPGPRAERPAAPEEAPAPRPSRIVLPETVTAPEPIAPLSGLVLLAGDGQPIEVIEEVVGLFAEHLAAAGVEAEVVPRTVWWRRGLDGALPDLLATARASEAASVLFIDMSFGYREKLKATCVGADGRELWRVGVSGGSGYTDHRPHDLFNAELVERLYKKLDKRIGGPGLPQ